MRQTMKKSIAMLLVVLQLLVLLPFAAPNARAAGTEPETPVLNETVVGTVKFQSFNFLGDNASGEDGTDYHTTFYYSDDYFSPSAINSAADSKTMLWSDLDNPSLAACSMDFAVASMTSAEGDVVSASSRNWDNSDYSDKDKNVVSFLSACGFDNIEPNSEMYQAPSRDSIGYTLASKPITVWNGTENHTYTLIAVGIRGAGYGAEWANNVTIGDPATRAMPSNGRHFGFDQGAQTVCAGIRDYLSAHNVTGDVKYWVCGFSRAAAVANLAAGYLTDDPNNIYKTSIDDVYGYTYECPQAASTSENALNYKNIHNILNPMDAVPKVSPDEFHHQRLGVDYQMPYHGNTTAAENTSFYNQMYSVLQTIAVGSRNGAADPLIAAVNPSSYPYNRPISPRTITPGQLISDAVDGVLAENFGTVASDPTYTYREKNWLGVWVTRTYEGNVDSMLGDENGDRVCDWYMDDFIDHLIDVFLVSAAWDRHYSSSTENILTHRAHFIDTYQEHFRTAFGYLLDFSGPAFLGMIDKIINAVGNQISLSNLLEDTGFALAFTNFYSDPKGTYYPWGDPPWIGDLLWNLQPRKDVLIDQAKPIVKNVMDNMIPSDYVNREGITRAQFEQSLDYLVELVVDLYADELDWYDSQYFGTSLKNLWTILCTHEQETVLSWIMSLDPMHMNRSCRTVTLPAGCSATLYEYRPELEGSIDDALRPAAPVVAEVKNGAIAADTLKDERISCTASNGSIVIRYPASLQIRVDVTSDSAFSAGAVRVADYKTTEAHTNVSAGRQQFEGLPSSGYSSVTSAAYTNVTAANNSLTQYDDAILPGDTLHISADEITAYDGKNTAAYSLLIDKAPTAEIAEYGKTDAGLTTGTDAASAVQLGGSSAVTTTDDARSIPTRSTHLTVPASSIYFDDELTGGDPASYEGRTARLDQDDEGTILWYQFRGSRIDLYCTTDDTAGYVMAAVYENNDGTPGERVAVKTMKSSSETTRYNVPTISFDGLDTSKDHFLQLYALAGSNYRLDGIRVYHGADETDAAVRAAYEAEAEQDARYVNLRALLLGSVSDETLSETIEDGALFFTDSGESYALTSEEYTTVSPKNEIYLARGQSVAFQIAGTYEKVMVGMSAPDSRTGGGSVRMTDGDDTKTLPVASALDRYYEVTPASDGSVVIQNAGDAMISITNVKLSGVYTPPAEPLNTSSALMVTRSLLQYAADFRTQTAPTTDLSGLIRQLISQFVERLFRSVTQLFGH